MSQQNFISKEVRIKELIRIALKKEPRYLNGKKLIFCKKKSDLYKHDDVAIKISEIDERTFEIYILNLSSSEYQALESITNEICLKMKVKNIEFCGSNFSKKDYATMKITF